MKGRNIGYGIPTPKQGSTADAKDPFYGSVKIKKNNFTAVVVSAKANHTAIVAIDRKIEDKKYKRFFKRRSTIAVHNPPSINAKEGDVVRVFETRPLSKTKHHVIVQVVGQEVEIKGQDLDQEAKEAKKKSSERRTKRRG